MLPRIFSLALILLAHAAFKVAGDLQKEAVAKDIFLRLYTSNDIEQFVDVPLLEAKDHVARMNLRKPTVIYLHGYTGSARSMDAIAITTAYLERGDHNVIVVDWSLIAGKNYLRVVWNTQSVGIAVAAAIDAMINEGLPLKSIHVVGHSLGAQVAGYIGRRTASKLPRITGLDPAGPFFNFILRHLSPRDANFVDTIHTDAGSYGINRISGNASFYPNNGKRIQPGCPTKFNFSSPEEYCSHHRSFIYYAESLRTENSFIATGCENYRKFLNGSCDDGIKVSMGIATPTDTKGTFYLRTRSEVPFGMQMEGAMSPIYTRSHNRKTTNHEMKNEI